LTDVLLDFPKGAIKIRKHAIRMAFRRDAVASIKRLTAGESTDSTADEGSAATECLLAMQKLQNQLLEKDTQLQKVLEDSIALQAELQNQIPLLDTHMRSLQKLKIKSDRNKSAQEKDRLAKTLQAAKDVIRLQDQLATNSASSVKESQYKFWKARQVLVRNAMAEVS